MTGAGKLFAAAVISLLGVGAQTPGLAQDNSEAAQVAELRSLQTNEALLMALTERRTEILRMPDSAERERLLKLVDGRIAEVRRRLGL